MALTGGAASSTHLNQPLGPRTSAVKWPHSAEEPEWLTMDCKLYCPCMQGKRQWPAGVGAVERGHVVVCGSGVSMGRRIRWGWRGGGFRPQLDYCPTQALPWWQKPAPAQLLPPVLGRQKRGVKSSPPPPPCSSPSFVVLLPFHRTGCLPPCAHLRNLLAPLTRGFLGDASRFSGPAPTSTSSSTMRAYGRGQRGCLQRFAATNMI